MDEEGHERQCRVQAQAGLEEKGIEKAWENDDEQRNRRGWNDENGQTL